MKISTNQLKINYNLENTPERRAEKNSGSVQIIPLWITEAENLLTSKYIQLKLYLNVKNPPFKQLTKTDNAPQL